MLLGIDIGSSGVKAALVDPERGVLATAGAGVELFSPHPGWAEADPKEWWDAVCGLVPRLLDQAGTTADAIEGVAASGMVPAVLALDADDRPLRRAILQNDARANVEVQELGELLGDIDLLGLTGSALTQQSVAPTLRWLERYEPDLFASTATVMGSYDWIARMLGAEVHVERNWAIESGLFGLDDEVLTSVLDRASIPKQLLPVVRPPGAVVGAVSASASSQSSLRAGTPIVVGGADHVSSAYGAGLLVPGDWLVKLGGAGDILVVSDAPLVDARLYLDAHPAGGWLPNGCMATSGSLVRWLAGVSGDASLDQLDVQAAATPPGAGGVVCLPYFLGEKSPLHDPGLGVRSSGFISVIPADTFIGPRWRPSPTAFAITSRCSPSAERCSDRPGSPTAAATPLCGSRSSPTCSGWSCGRCSIILVRLWAPLWPPGWVSAKPRAGTRSGRSSSSVSRSTLEPSTASATTSCTPSTASSGPAIAPISRRLAEKEWS